MKNANDNTPSVTKNGKTLEYRNLKRKDRTRFGTKYPGEVLVGHHADVTPGKCIRLHGLDTNRWEPAPHDLTFKVGDRAIYGSYNLIYTGTITSITAKTVTVTEDHGGRRHRMTITDFAYRNEHYDAESISAHNQDTMLHI